MPRRLLPMLVTTSTGLRRPDCLFEVKWNGVRAMAAVTAGAAKVSITLPRLGGREFGTNRVHVVTILHY
jgi:hypothetical protein